MLILGVLLAITAFAGEWEWQNPLPQGNSLYDVEFVTDEIGWAAGLHGTLLRTSDGGETWERIPMEANWDFWAVAFADSLHGWIAGGESGG
ncbi:hypothetical protein KKC97_14315 [bacterium]|nr:hypothetical protein [bacterium]MBU1638833.1 hypothetical protein [bacterium]MBU1920595.1 hypothetical protein [bacterium]